MRMCIYLFSRNPPLSQLFTTTTHHHSLPRYWKSKCRRSRTSSDGAARFCGICPSECTCPSWSWRWALWFTFVRRKSVRTAYSVIKARYILWYQMFEVSQAYTFRSYNSTELPYPCLRFNSPTSNFFFVLFILSFYFFFVFLRLLAVFPAPAFHSSCFQYPIERSPKSAGKSEASARARAAPGAAGNIVYMYYSSISVHGTAS